jgi:hypothetical protein
MSELDIGCCDQNARFDGPVNQVLRWLRPVMWVPWAIDTRALVPWS